MSIGTNKSTVDSCLCDHMGEVKSSLWRGWGPPLEKLSQWRRNAAPMGLCSIQLAQRNNEIGGGSSSLVHRSDSSLGALEYLALVDFQPLVMHSDTLSIETFWSLVVAWGTKCICANSSHQSLCHFHYSRVMQSIELLMLAGRGNLILQCNHQTYGSSICKSHGFLVCLVVCWRCGKQDQVID